MADRRPQITVADRVADDGVVGGVLSTPVTDDTLGSTIERLVRIVPDDATWTTIKEQPHR